MEENNQKKFSINLTPWTICLVGFLLSVSITTYIYFGDPKASTFAQLFLMEKTGTASAETRNENPFQKLQLTAKAAIVYDAQTGRILFSKNESVQLPLASITKVMSAVTALKLADNFNIKSPIAFDEHNWNLKDLLKFGLIASSNEGIASVAHAISLYEKKTDENVFARINLVDEMNALAKELKLKQTYFINETGLDFNEKIAGAYGSAKDVAKLFAYAIKKNPDVLGATRYQTASLTTLDGAIYNPQNTNIDVEKMTTLIASKTGTTDLSGGNLVIAFDAGLSHPIVIVALGSTPESRLADVESLSRATLEYLK